MKWLKAYLRTEMGRQIGRGEGEAVYFNPENGLLIVKDGSDPYFTSLSSMSQYKLGLIDESYLEGIISRASEVSESFKVESVENKKEVIEPKKDKNWFKK